MSLQVGSLCYADIVAAAGAACAQFIPQAVMIPGTPTKTGMLSCVGVSSAGKMQMQTTIATPDTVTTSGGSCTWTITSGTNSVGFSASYAPNALCASRASAVVAFGSHQTLCTSDGLVAHEEDLHDVDNTQSIYEWASSACSGVTTTTVPGTVVLSTAEMLPAFGDCQWPAYMAAASVIVAALLLLWAMVYGPRRINETLLRWSRGDSA